MKSVRFGELVTTVVFATYAAGVIAGLVLFGHWSDQVGRRPMLHAGLVLSGLSAVVFAVAGGLGWLFVGRVLSGLSAGIVTGTATATTVDLVPERSTARASLVAAAVNMGSLGAGPLLAGVLAQYAPLPLMLCFIVDLALVVLAVVAVQAVAEPVRRASTLRLRPQKVNVPIDIRGVFTRSAIAGFAGFAVLGLFTAVSPAFVGTVLHNTDPAITGAVVLSLFIASTIGQSLSSLIGERRALLIGCAGLIVGMIFVGMSLPARKTTLLSLIAGVRQPSTGTVRWVTATGASPPHLGGCAWIGQQTVLLPGTVSDNIRIGRPAASLADVGHAVAVAGLADLIARLPEGLDTPLGESGSGLSTGEARRIAIARAFLSDAELWVLDEPTAHLDPHAEAQVIDALHNVTQGRTVIVATHSAALARSADAVLSLADGTIHATREAIPA